MLRGTGTGILHLRRGPLRAEPARGYYEIDSVEGAWNTGRIEEPNLGYKPSFKGGYFPVSPTDTFHDLRGEMVYEMRKIGIVVEAHHHEVATAGQSEIDMKFQPLLMMADQFMVVQVHLQERGEASRQERDVHAEANLRRQRQRDAHAHVVVEGWQPAVRGRGLRRTERARPPCGGRPLEARARHSRVRGADDQLLSPSRAGVRGAGKPRAVGAQPLRGHQNPDILEESQGQAARVSLPDPSCNGYWPGRRS